MGLAAFLPQLAALLAISVAYGKDLPFALFALTMVFVAFNKVCTAQVWTRAKVETNCFLVPDVMCLLWQYFLWYTAFLPLILPLTTLRLRWKGAAIIVAWLASEVRAKKQIDSVIAFC
jgi:phosphatidylinositol glycan class M